jgi:hypothetical protein
MKQRVGVGLQDARREVRKAKGIQKGEEMTSLIRATRILKGCLWWS